MNNFFEMVSKSIPTIFSFVIIIGTGIFYISHLNSDIENMKDSINRLKECVDTQKSKLDNYISRAEFNNTVNQMHDAHINLSDKLQKSILSQSTQNSLIWKGIMDGKRK